MRIEVLSPPTDVTALGFRRWFRSSVEAIGCDLTGAALTLVLLLPRAISNAFPPAVLNGFLEDVVADSEAVIGLETVEVDEALSGEELSAVLKDLSAERGTTRDDWPNQTYGYATETNELEPPSDLPSAGLVCLVANITPVNVDLVSQKARRTLPLGSWFCAVSLGSAPVVLGPFAARDQAIECGRKAGAIRFKEGR